MRQIKWLVLLFMCVSLASCAHLATSLIKTSNTADASYNNQELDPHFASFDPDAVAVPALPAAPPAIATEDINEKQVFLLTSKLQETERKLHESEKNLLETKQKLSEAENKLAELDRSIAAQRSSQVTAESAELSTKSIDSSAGPDQESAARSPNLKADTLERLATSKPIGSGKTLMYVNGDQIHIRTKPNRYSKSVGMVYGGQPVLVTMNGDWAKLEEGKWLRSRWLTPKKPKKFKEVKPVELSRSLSTN